MRLLNRPQPIPHESLESLLGRLGRANYYVEPAWYAPFLDPPHSANPNRIRAPAHLRALAELAGLDASDVAALTLHRIPALPGSLGEQAHAAGNGKVCPICLSETGALLLPWSLRLVTVCPVHLVILTGHGEVGGASVASDAAGVALARLVWSALGYAEPYPPPGVPPATMELLSGVAAPVLLRFQWRMGGLLLRHDPQSLGLETVELSSRGLTALDAAEAHRVFSAVMALLLDWPQGWHRMLGRIADRDLPGPHGRCRFPSALASSFRGPEWTWLHRSWDEFVSEQARRSPTAGIYAWLGYRLAPRDGEGVPSLELLAPAPRGSGASERRARLRDAPKYRPLAEPLWQLEGEAGARVRPRPDAPVSLRDAARYLGTTSAHVTSLVAAGLLRAERCPFWGTDANWLFRRDALATFLDGLPVQPIPERGMRHAVGLDQAMELLAEIRPSLAQLVVAMRAGSLQQGRVMAFCAYPSPTLGRLWFSRNQICEYLWYRREAIERERHLPADHLARRYGMETLRLWYAAGLLAPCQDRTDRKRIRWWYDDWEVSYRMGQGQLPECLGPGIDLSNAYISKPDDVLEWRDRWYDSRQTLRYLDRYGVRGANEERLAEWVREGSLSCRVQPGVESGAQVRWYPREEVEELQRQLYAERCGSGRAARS